MNFWNVVGKKKWNVLSFCVIIGLQTSLFYSSCPLLQNLLICRSFLSYAFFWICMSPLWCSAGKKNGVSNIEKSGEILLLEVIVWDVWNWKQTILLWNDAISMDCCSFYFWDNWKLSLNCGWICLYFFNYKNMILSVFLQVIFLLLLDKMENWRNCWDCKLILIWADH